MPKRDKLTEKQKRQVAKKKHQRLSQQDKPTDLNQLGHLSELIHTGLVISRFGEQADIINLSDQKTYRCYLRQNLGSLVPGDQVSFRLLDNHTSDTIQGVIEVRKERISLLQRPSAHQGLKPIVANIDQVFVVVAPLPDFSSVLLDRYLVAIENAGIDIKIIINKSDLCDEISAQKIESQLLIYKQLGYSCSWVSSQTSEGIDEIKAMAINNKSILVGQSGVGKSSIINCLFPNQVSRVNRVSKNSRLGQHTTTTSQLFMLPQDLGFIIDSPGIREFSLSHMQQLDVSEGFVEFRPYLGSCKFRDCQHVNEIGCEIIAAVKQKKIHPQRWSNYKKIIAR